MLSGAREAELTALGVISGVHQPNGVVGDLGGGSLELVDVRRHACAARADAAARRSGAGRHFGEIAQEGGEVRQEDARRRCRCCKRLQGPHLLCGRRHLARAGAAAHVADRISAARDARLRDSGRRGARIRPPGASRRRRNVVEYRSGRPMRGGRCSPMRRWCSNTSCASASRSRSCSPRSACARVCSIRCSSKKTRKRTR